jgi:hypothetical protein
LKVEIQKAASALIGMPLWAAGRAADLAWFQFGQRHTVTDSRSNPKEVGEYALHLQCAWRIVQGERITVASRDLYYPAGSVTPEVPVGFHWDVQGANRLDERLQHFMKEASLFVVQVETGHAGGLQMFLGNDVVLEVFPDDSFDGEHWRLFRPYESGPHFVVSGTGIVEE